ncbi:intermembrane transport protein PqiB [Dyella caseinilytica]|uniref:MCE family protein n=1 Tax=Dyella caseinilytica TaxID=1849581 RepID=A0ABX7GXE9_9GAMM|nr:MlaD family protein [Dyella caseinilytica]QRN54618.1 MCE family protein [Dyella caseinilytica]GFZ95551.1 mammalian cell entry protein [Dyella caseinilytica]
MTDKTQSDLGGQLPEPVVRHRRVSASLIWLVPIVAALVGLSLVINAWMQQGPAITISFQSADGLDPGKTVVKYKDVVIGKVTTIRLSPDRSKVNVKVDLEKSAAGIAVSDTRFWVVRPRIGLGGVSGIDTLLSGSFIGVDVGQSKQEQTDFVGLETPPSVTHDAQGKSFILHTGDLGSLDIGSPVYFRRLQVGRVASYKLNDDGKGVTLQIFIERPYDKFVTTDSRFWNASGVDVSLGADGLKLNTQSLATVLAGGVAFLDSPGPHPSAEPANENAVFTLFDTQANAMAPPDGEPHYIRMRFDQPLRGLTVNAPVEFLGINIGNVVSIRMDYDEKTGHFPIYVGAVIYPDRLGAAHQKLVALAKSQGDNDDLSHMMGTLVQHGLRAQAKIGNLLTGQLFISLDFLKNASKAEYNPDARPLEIPTAPGNFDKLQEQLADIVDKIQKIPFDSIGNNLNETLATLNKTLNQVNNQVLPEFQGTLKGANQTLGTANNAFSPDSPLQQNLNSTLQELQRMARSLRTLTDYLDTNPSSLIRGRSKDAPLPANSPTSTAQPQQGSKP